MVPFALLRDEFHATDIVFCNLECCLYRPPGGHAVEHQGFFDPRVAGEAVRSVAIQATGLANNVDYGEAAIMTSIARLDELGGAYTGAGANRAPRRS
jgi:Bacterial capsule synthesis protein PGA_cap